MIFPLLFITILLLIILAGYWYDATPWRHCRTCGWFLNTKTGKEYNYLPAEADGITKPGECEKCRKGNP